MSTGASTETLVFNGVNGATGGYLLPPMTAQDISRIAQGEKLDPQHLKDLQRRHFKQTEKTFRPAAGIDPKDLAQAGWGVIFAQDAEPAVREALAELLEHRKRQASQVKESRYREYLGTDAYQPAESAYGFLGRFGTGPGPANPDKVPYYLLLVGDPEVIPYSFQYQLDVERAVGRIHFDTLEEYAQYARSVVSTEAGPPLPRRATFFGVRNDDDQATEMSATKLVAPLAELVAADQPEWSITTVLGEDATKAALAPLLGGDQTPAVLFTASHGMGFPLDDPRLLPHQGALLCQDWLGPKKHRGRIAEDDYFAADDVASDARLLGLVAFHFACFGAGTPRLDDFAHHAFEEAAPIAPNAFVAGLPRRLLGHPRGGALAVVGHVERAWSYSFDWPGVGPQLDVFQSTLKQLMEGYPLGAAVEFFNGRYAELSTVLTSELNRVAQERLIPDEIALAGMWTANNDARSYAIVGDPAVRLVVGEPTPDTSRPTITEVRLSVRSSPTPPSPDAEGGTTSPTAPPARSQREAGVAPAAEFGVGDWLSGSPTMRDAVARLAGAVEEFADRLGEALKRATDDASSVTIKTYVSDDLSAVGDDFSGPATLRAVTRMTLSGDTVVYVPQEATDLQVGLWAMHVDMVERAQANRTELLKAAVGAATTLIEAVRPG
jgi:hypothetical protein